MILAATAALVLALAAAALSAAATAARPRRTVCELPGRTVLANPVLRLVHGQPDWYRYGFYACRPGRAAATYLFEQDFMPAPQQLAGRFAVGETVFCDTRREPPWSCEGRVAVLDARTNRVRRTPIERGDQGQVTGAGNLLVTRTGWAAWMRWATGGRAGIDVWAWPPYRPPRVVASGEDVADRSLATDGRRLYWTQGGQARSAPLR